MNPIPSSLRAAFLAAATLLALPFAGRADYQSSVQALSPLGYWRFDDTAASPPLNSVANSGSAAPAGEGYAVGNALKGQPGIVGNSARFTNPSNNVSVTYLGGKIDVPFNPAFNPGAPFSIEFWARPNTLGSLVLPNDPGTCPLSNFDPNNYPNNRSGWLFYCDYLGRWSFRLGNTSGTIGNIFASTGNAAPGVWQHIVATFDGTNMNLYANATLIGTASVTPGAWMSNSVSFLRIGGTPLNGSGASAPYISSSSNNGNRGYDGWVDELAIYPKILSGPAIAAHYAAVSTNNAGYHAQVIADGPAGYWTLDEPAATPPSPSALPVAVNLGTLGAAANGTNQWGTLAAQPGTGYGGFGIGNKSVFFDGENGYFQVNDTPALRITGNITMMAWVKPTQKDFFRDIISHGFGSYEGETFLRISRGGGTLGYGTGYYYEVGVNDGNNYYDSVYFPIPPGDIGNWVFLAGTFDGAAWNLYRNGVLVGSVAPSAADTGAFDVTNRWVIGSRSDPPPGQSMFFAGYIDEPAVFDRALSPAEIAGLYTAAQVPPVITQPPQAPGTVYSGSSLALSVWAEGNPTLRYAWYSNGVAIGATATNIVLNNLTAGAKTVSVVVTNNYGAVTSSIAFNVVSSQPVLTAQPVPATRFTGYPFSFTVGADGSQPLKYFWKLGSTVVQAGSSPTYSGIASVANAGTYSCIVSNSFGTTNSAPAQLTVSGLPAAYSDAVLASGPVAYWRLGEHSGTAAQDSVGGNNGTYNSTTLGLPGYSPLDSDTAVAFSGTNSYVGGISGTGINFWGDTNFALEAWVKAPAGQAHEATIIAKGNGPNGSNRTEQFGLDVAEGVYRFFTSGDSTVYAASATEGPNGAWQHVVGVYDSDDLLSGGFVLYIYVNGELQGTAPIRPYGLITTTTPISIGSKRSGSSTPYDDTFNGTVDEVAVYGYVLDPATVQAHYSSAFGENMAPSIQVAPVPTTNYAGLRATFQVTASGSQPLSYQWRKNNVDIDGATSRTLTLTNLSTGDAANYSVRVSNSVNSTNSPAAALTVLSPPASAPSIPGLVVHLTFDNTLADASGRGNGGTAIHTTSISSNTAAATFVSGPLGQALHYATTAENTGGNTSIATDAQYVTLGVRPDLQFGSTVNFSVAYWIRLPQDYFGGDLPFFTDAAGATGNRGFVFAPAYGFGTADPQPFPSPENYGGWGESIYGAGGGFRIYGDLASINDGQWHHLAHVFDRAAGTTITYLDGVPAHYVKTLGGSNLKDAGNIDTGLAAVIGQDPTGRYGETGSGDIDDLGVWRKALTPLEAASIYSAAASNHLSYVSPPVTISAQRLSATQLQITWSFGTLQSASSVQGPYTDVPSATSPYTVIPGATAAQFYRLSY
ncbi:MAG: LamG-like jellyroll fold domain-containing protein [Verrucomicrobiota bacterium]